MENDEMQADEDHVLQSLNRRLIAVQVLQRLNQQSHTEISKRLQVCLKALVYLGIDKPFTRVLNS